MPIFEYICNSCGKSFEELIVSGSHSKTIICPQCNSQEISKQFSSMSVPSSSTSSLPSCAESCSSAQSCCSSGMCPKQ